MSLSEKLKKQVSLFSEKNRLETFQDWHFADDKPCSKQKLAEAGFYFIGTSNEPDAVECFYCGKALDGWDEVDNPWLEHQNHSSHCNFAKLGKPEGGLPVKQWMDLISSSLQLKLRQNTIELNNIYRNEKMAKLASVHAAVSNKKR